MAQETTDRTDLYAQARNAVRQATREVEVGMTANLRLRALKHLRDTMGGNLLGPYLAAIDQVLADLDDDAMRERVARWLYVTALGKHLRRDGEIEWDEGKANPRDVEHCRARAEELLAVVFGKDG